MKFSITQLIFALSVVSFAAVLTEDVQGQKENNNSQEKWLGYAGWRYGAGSYGGLGGGYGWLNPYIGGAYGYGVYNGGWRSAWFRRRSLQQPKAEAHSQGGDSTVQCSNSSGQKEEFSTQSCLKAANKIATEHLSSATCGKCTIQLRSQEGLVAPKSLPPSQLADSVNNILKACSKGQNKLLSASELSRRSPAEGAGNNAANSQAGKDAFAVVLLKGNGPEC